MIRFLYVFLPDKIQGHPLGSNEQCILQIISHILFEFELILVLINKSGKGLGKEKTLQNLCFYFNKEMKGNIRNQDKCTVYWTKARSPIYCRNAGQSNILPFLLSHHEI